MCEEQGDKTKVTYSRDVVASITELVWRNIKIWTKDVEAFARYVIDRHSKQHRSRFERSHNIEPTMMTKKSPVFQRFQRFTTLTVLQWLWGDKQAWQAIDSQHRGRQTTRTEKRQSQGEDRIGIQTTAADITTGKTRQRSKSSKEKY
jgi:CENP-S protein